MLEMMVPMLADAAEVTAVSPALLDTIKENWLVVSGGLAGSIAGFKMTLSTIKSSITAVGNAFSKKKDESDVVIQAKKEEYEAKKLAMIQKAEDMKIKLELDKQILDYELKLPFIENPEAKLKVQTRIAELKGQKAAIA